MQKLFFARIFVGCAAFASASAGYGQFVAFNDHARGPATAPNTTSWSADPAELGGATGPLKNITNGANLAVTVTVTAQGSVTFDGASGIPAPGTPLYDVFNGFVDFAGLPNPSIALNGDGAVLTYTFTGLDSTKRYSFKGGAVRGNGYTNRWTTFELVGADSFLSAHTPNALTTAQVPTISDNQCVINTGANDTTGDMADWENIDPGVDGTISVNSFQYLGTIPNGGASSGAKGYGITGFRLEEAPLVPRAPAIVNQPGDVVTGELLPATFRVGAQGNPPPTFQWYKNDTLITNATNSIYIAPASLSDNGAVYKVAVINVTNGVVNTLISSNAVLTINPDHTAPALVSAESPYETSVLVTFSEPVLELTATNIENYSIISTNGNPTVFTAALQPDGSNVVLTTSLQASATTFYLTVNNVRDRSAATNAIAANSTTTFATVAGFSPTDVGNPGVPGSMTSVTDGFDVTGSGADIGGASDQFTFAYQQRSANFDIKVRLQGLSLGNVWSKAGLMVRQSLTPDSTYAAALSTPDISGSFFQARTNRGGTTLTSGNSPVNYPSTWLRLQRSGNNFVGYSSFDGSNWLKLGSAVIPMSNPVYFGLVVSSHTNSIASLAQFRDIGSVIGGTTVAALTLPIEPPGPSSRTCGLAITEIMYKPASRTDGLNIEFIEIYNSNPFFEDISGYQIAGDINYTFPLGTIMPANGYLVIAKAPGDVQSAYAIANVLGPYTGSLKSSGNVQLLNQAGSIYLNIPYSNNLPWPVAADGTGHSLVLAHPSYGEGFPQAWSASDSFGGSPGKFDGYTAEPIRNVVINEFLANTSASGFDFIELYNHGNQEVNISGAYLSDDPHTNKFRIPDGTIIPARGFKTFDENQMGFGLNAGGETLYLVNSNLTRVVDAVSFEAQSKGVSSGRVPDGAAAFYPLASATPGAPNSAILINDIVINELMCHPISENVNDEYIEIYNRGPSSVDLTDWQFVAGVTFTFSNVVLAPDGYLVIAKSTTNLFAHYPNLNSGNTVGNFGGTLKHSGERVALARPEPHVTTNALGGLVTNIINVVVDEVSYVGGGRWGVWSAGGGSSLELIDPRANHRLPSNWGDSDETHKAGWTTIETAGTLDNGQTWPAGNPIDRLELIMLGEGECLLDNVEVLSSANVNLLTPVNQTFESGIGNWVPQGNHIRSTLETTDGYNSSQSLHIRSSARGDTGANRIRVALATPLAVGSTATIRAKVKWLHGWPELVLRVRGNYLEATGAMNLPVNLGTPGARNSTAVTNAGPAIYQVSHSPVVPPANSPIVVTARVHDPDGISSLILKYRNDTSSGYITAGNMVDDGTGGDLVAGDGIFSATIPGQPAGTLIAFVVQAVDGANVSSLFPAGASPNVRECLVRFGDPVSASSYATYRYWMTTTNVNSWINRPSLSNERVEGTFVYGNFRAVYNISGKYSGSPYHQGFPSPVANTCHYSLEFPADDLLLGTANFNKIHAPGNGPWDDDNVQREQAAYWLVRQMGLPWNYRRYVNFVFNGNRRLPNSLMEDTQTPGNDVINEVFPTDPNGNLFKLQPWFEFDDITVTGGGAANFNNNSWCVMNQFTTTGGVKKLARYRHNYLTRAVHGSANDYSNVYALVDAASNPNTPSAVPFVQAMESVIDSEQWLRTFAVEHAVGNWDSFGNQNAQNMYGYKPAQGKWQLLIWDYNIVLASPSGPNAPSTFPTTLFQYQTADNNMGKMYNTPIYRRAYWRSLKELAAVHMANPQFFSLLDAKYRSFLDTGLTGISSPQAIKDNINSAKTTILSLLAAEDPGTFAVDGGSVFTVTNNFITLTGTAPVEAKTIKVNGREYPITWNSVSGWSLIVALPPGTSLLVLQGFDLNGNPLPAFTTTVSVTYTGPVALPENSLVISEIMYHPAVSNASYIEIFNTSATASFDLSNWRLSGLGYTFPEGTVIASRQFLVIVKDRVVFGATYGWAIPVVGQFSGNLNPDGEKLALIKPGATPEQDQAISAVHYEAVSPWVASANTGGVALQLIDSSQDESRVSNWSDGSGWRFHSFTSTPGAASGSTQKLSFILNAPGDFYIDDLSLVTGSVAGAGPNLLQNGDLEAGSLAPWSAVGNHSSSTVSTALKNSGNASLHLLATGPGSLGAPISSVSQTVTGIVASSTYTLSFWYLPSTNATGFNYNIFRSTNSINLRPSLASPGAPNVAAASVEPYPLLWINEIQPNNVTGITDNNAEHDPWVEIYNSSANAITLDGYALANTYANLGQWPFPNGTVINPGEFKIIFIDGQAGQSLGNELHTSFRLDATNGSIVLSKAGRILDYINYTNMEANFSYGSFPDGQLVDRERFFNTTPGGPNNGSPVPVIINEWLASNTNNLVNPATGKTDDWIELYNFGFTPVDLSGYFLTDNLGQKKQWAFPAGTVIAARGYLFIWADNEATNSTPGDLHAHFQLSKSGEQIGLFTPDGLTVDAVTFGPQLNDVSQGRYPDGNFAGVLYFMTTPTANAANVVPANLSAPALSFIANRTIDEGTLLMFTNLVTDADIPAQTLTFTLVSNAVAGVSLNAQTGVFSWTPAELQGGAAYNFTVQVSDNGFPARTNSRSFSVTVNKANSPPHVFLPFTSRTIPEETTLSFSVTASDSDLPVQHLAFSLDPGAPAGATIDAASGLFNWTPGETQGPTTNVIFVRVTDDGGSSLSATQAVTVIVTEVNKAPVLVNPGSFTIDETTRFTNQIIATDADLPTNRLTFSTVAPFVSGVTIGGSSGWLSWTPTETQGGSSYVIKIRVADNGTPSLSVTQSFTITVREVNSPPVLTNLNNTVATITELTSITLTNKATDSDVPVNTLTYELVSPLSGASVQPASGVFTWTPSESQASSSNSIRVRVFDNGVPSLSATQSFTVFVISSIVITEIRLDPTDSAKVRITWASKINRNYQLEYRDNLDPATAWQLVPNSQVTAAGASQSFSVNRTASTQRFYRVVRTN